MATHDDFREEPAPRAKKSSGSKVLLILGTIAGLFLVVCCGLGGFAYYKLKDVVGFTTDAAKIKTHTEEVSQIDVPDELKPMQASWFSAGGVGMKMIMYQGGTSGQSVLVIMQMNQPGTNSKQMREQMLQQMRAQQAQGGASSFNSQINAQSTETKIFKINGEQVEFDFIKGTRAGDPTVIRQVVGTFPGKNGTVLFMLVMPDSEYDEAAVVKMIKSIRVPGSEATTEMSEGAAADEGMTEKEGDDEPGTDTEATPDKTE